MKLIILTACIGIAFAYTDIPDDYDFNTILNDDNLLRDFFGCLVDIGPCTELGKVVKSHVQQAVSNGCADCDAVQKHYAGAFLKRVKEVEPAEFAAYVKKYDPDGKHVPLLEQALANF